MNGVLVIDKPSGPTSHDVVARVRRATGLRRIGHTGTLDPLARGVLPLVLGRATRLAPLLTGADKTYAARIRLGAATNTYDATGKLVAAFEPEGLIDLPPPPPAIDRSAIARALDAFRGEFWQAPPPFSAKKIGGVRAYRLARRQAPVEPKPVRVRVSELELIDIDGGAVDLRIVCSAGFYVRSLAHDLGATLGVGGYLERLVRTRSGDFGLEDTVPLDQVEREQAEALGHLIPLTRLLPDMPGVILSERGLRRATHGNAVSEEDVESSLPAADRVRLLDREGSLIGIAERETGRLLHPVIVLV